MFKDAYGSPIGEGLFYLGPHTQSARATLYYALGNPHAIQGKKPFMIENTHGKPHMLEQALAAQLLPLTDDALMYAIQQGRVTIYNSEWFERRSGMKLTPLMKRTRKKQGSGKS